MKSKKIVSAVVFGVLLLGPLAARASTRQPHADISISWDGEFDRAHGIRSGHGTLRDPYVISGWTIGNLAIKDTDRAIRIVDNTITGTLTLNWLGSAIEVRNNDIGDLRVNENVPRWGEPTAGSIHHNTFVSVSQLRHFDGQFVYNAVGAAQSGTLSSSYPSTRAVNFDGFNNAVFAHNTIYGYVDARLHGHHHSSAYGMPSHMHAGEMGGEMVDHTRRYHQVTIASNAIYSSAAYALAYLDTDHAGNDRTANSETNPWLNAPHVHFTRVRILSNALYGSGILVNVFNATDERHRGAPSGSLEIAGNRVTLERETRDPFHAMQGIEVEHARYLQLRIRANTVTGPAPLVEVPAAATTVPKVAAFAAQLRAMQSQGAGIMLDDLDHASVVIDGDRVTNRQFGVRALRLTSSVRWTITSLATSGVQQPVAYDSTVKNAPQH